MAKANPCYDPLNDGYEDYNRGGQADTKIKASQSDKAYPYDDYKKAVKAAQDWDKIETIEDMPFDLPKDINLGTFHKWMGIIYREHRALVIAAKSSGFDPKPVVTSAEPQGQFTPAVKDWLKAKIDEPLVFKMTPVELGRSKVSDTSGPSSLNPITVGKATVNKPLAKKKAPAKATQVTKPRRKR